MSQDIKNWNPDDSSEWESTGKAIANRNLWISIPSLLSGFAVWLMWGIITVQMLNTGYGGFDKSQLFTLAAIAGLSGATLRIPSTFFIRLAGGRNTIFLTTSLLILPALGLGMALSNPDTPFWTFQVLALLSGFGGGNFASSMSNISFFFPKKIQGYSLGMNAGLGNFGVTTMQIVIPLVMTLAVLGNPTELQISSGTLIGKISAGTDTYLQNAGYVWLIILIPLAIASWLGMNNITEEHVSPKIGSTLGAFIKIIVMLILGLATAAFGLWLMLPEVAYGSGLMVSKWVALPIIIALTVFLLKFLPLGVDYKEGLKRQYKIFENKHTWAMTIIYVMTFGSFIGYAATLALSIKVIFGFQHIMVDGVMTHNAVNPNGPSALTYAWMGAFVGALIRPLGGMIADKIGGAKVTQIISGVMVLSALGVAYFMKQAYASATPEEFFWPFLILFVVLFAMTGLGNGSTFRTISQVFNKEQAGPVLGWTSAVAAYGAFIIPKVFGEQIKLTTPENALYGFAVFYGICMVINWWFYLRKNAEFHNP
ncbi:Nitrate/nitrite transporter NarK [uncultured Gammaproteobacteria bacterium]|jgi:NNP family nitrate/nitrite transporter-like MFS transporter|uniref:NarK/NasA family nitrate transporter n=1 Tax=thiotrophic endosymbiont of Bathymodiolus puteoserpentis (Logatchev) TaxID=343240 RepID=UPI0010B74428|nr:NarK/NasA family nitrate transporter [thiotrophic endosymbiont of Bathymodiolus puteoserpentis (Logatchev)]CAC9583307.1 Nitrate/nitrite transporter NarK/U [uncultured Gammaproteobacteria bacterium]CAC9597030.1 Nitrate/nitrite transporter NarK/U [uncultured Gammaproteobacteria bacterium]CAC9648405.1 Nitrate/nitrite transporter NarK/U [uncultured Gammaproteobacteria bacterium]CAC9987967.1 Nitrate/nitrite transporter NarK/U [uncultured Gammaproteobacteria bacterium]CAC9989867.1 Nitrate/nitrite